MTRNRQPGPRVRPACLFLACAVLVSGGVRAQTGKLVIVDHADSLVGTTIDGEEARELAGEVRFSQDQVRVSCDRATQFLKSGRVILNGNVVVRDDSVTMRAPRGIYHQNERRAEAFDGVVLEDGAMTLTAREGEYFVEEKKAHFRKNVIVREAGDAVRADSLTYYRVEKRSVAGGNVRVLDGRQHVTIAGELLDHSPEQAYSRVTGNPILFQEDTSDTGSIDTLVVRSRVMESYRGENRRLVATDSVRIIRKDLAALAGLAVFSPAGDSMLLRAGPVVWYEDNQVTGDSINMYLASHQLQRVLVVGDAFAASRTDTLGYIRFDQLSGATMNMWFEDRGLREVELDGRARSLYHLFEDSLANGMNKTSGDRITMRFTDGKVSSISVAGGVEGQYLPENLISGREGAFHLPGFLWRDDRPSLQPADRLKMNITSPR